VRNAKKIIDGRFDLLLADEAGEREERPTE
jgi:hypothetical protein